MPPYALLAVHLLFPVLGAAVFAGYFRISGWDKLTDIAAFLETAAIAHPFLIGIISGIAVQMENTAGHFQILLGTIPSRSGAYIGKCCYLIMWCAISTALGILLFAIFYPAVLPVFYIKPFIMLTLSAIPLYLISLNAGLFWEDRGYGDWYCRKFADGFVPPPDWVTLSGSSCPGAGGYDLRSTVFWNGFLRKDLTELFMNWRQDFLS